MVSRWNSTFKPFHNAHFSIRMPRVFDAYVIRWKNARRMMAKCSRAGFWVMPLFHHTSGLFPSCTCAVQNFCCHRCSSREIAHGKMALMENLLTLWHADGIPSRMQSSQFPFWIKSTDYGKHYGNQALMEKFTDHLYLTPRSPYAHPFCM